MKGLALQINKSVVRGGPRLLRGMALQKTAETVGVVRGGPRGPRLIHLLC